MFDPTRLGAALRAINRVLVLGRTLVGDGAESHVVYELLDRAEILPTLLAPDRSDDTTAEFREALAAIAADFAEAADILQDYDADCGLIAVANSRV